MDSPHDRETTITVPLTDAYGDGPIYSPLIPRLAAVGALAGGLLLGIVGYALASGLVAIAGFGQWSAAGTGPAAFAGFGVGAALGALAGGLVALRRMPRHTSG